MIIESNNLREAARRCRERRRNYIETLEANIRNIESKQLALMVKIFKEKNLRIIQSLVRFYPVIMRCFKAFLKYTLQKQCD